MPSNYMPCGRELYGYTRGFPMSGVYYYDHEKRIYNGEPDRMYFIKHPIHGHNVLEPLGWSHQGWTPGAAADVVAKLCTDNAHGESGLYCDHPLRFQKWIRTMARGVRYRFHPSRKINGFNDRYFSVRIQRHGVSIEKGLGWESEGWSEERAKAESIRLREEIRAGVWPRIKGKSKKKKPASAVVESLIDSMCPGDSVTREELLAWLSKHSDNDKQTPNDEACEGCGLPGATGDRCRGCGWIVGTVGRMYAEMRQTKTSGSRTG